MSLQEPENRGIAFGTSGRSGWRIHTRNPWIAPAAFDPEHMVVVLTGLGCLGRINAVPVSEVRQQALDRRRMEQAVPYPLQISQRFGVALPGRVHVSPNNLLERLNLS